MRELKNTIQRACLLAQGRIIGTGDLGLSTPAAAPGTAAGSDAEPDRESIERSLAKAGGVVAQAAADLGLSRQALYRRMDRLGISRP